MTARKLSDLSVAELAEMQRLWESEVEMPAAQIGDLFRVSKNAVIGCAHRRDWLPRRERNNAHLVAAVRAAIAEQVAPLKKAVAHLQTDVASMSARIEKLQAAPPPLPPSPSIKFFADDPRARRNHGSPGHGRIA